MNKRFEVGLARDEKVFANSGKHSGTGGAELGLGDFKGEFLALAGTNEAEGCSGPNCHWWLG